MKEEDEEEGREEEFERKEMTSLLLMWRHLDDSTCCVSRMHAQNLSLFPLFGMQLHTARTETLARVGRDTRSWSRECAVTGPDAAAASHLHSLSHSLSVQSN